MYKYIAMSAKQLYPVSQESFFALNLLSLVGYSTIEMYLSFKVFCADKAF